MLVTTALVTKPGTWQLSTAVLSYSYTEFIGFTLLWSGMSEAETRHSHRYYRLAAVLLVAGLLISGSRARIEGKSVEFMVGWQSAVGLPCVTAMLVVLAVRMIWLSLRELRNARRRRERLIAISTLSMGLVAAADVAQEGVLQISDQFGWTHTADYRHEYHSSSILFLISGVFMTAAVPLAMKLLALLGLDPISRSWRKLQPLRQAMSHNVPERVFTLHDDEPGRRKSQLQLHQTVVEIRDAILGVRAYFRELPDDDLTRFLAKPNAVPARDQDAAIAAFRLAHAVRAKAAGLTPERLDVEPALIAASRAATLEQETTELVAVAKWWPFAYAFTQDITESAVTPKASPTI